MKPRVTMKIIKQIYFLLQWGFIFFLILDYWWLARITNICYRLTFSFTNFELEWSKLKLVQDYAPASLSVKWLCQTKKLSKKILKKFYKKLYPRPGTEEMITNTIWEKKSEKNHNCILLYHSISFTIKKNLKV